MNFKIKLFKVIENKKNFINYKKNYMNKDERKKNLNKINFKQINKHKIWRFYKDRFKNNLIINKKN